MDTTVFFPGRRGLSQTQMEGGWEFVGKQSSPSPVVSEGGGGELLSLLPFHSPDTKPSVINACEVHLVLWGHVGDAHAIAGGRDQLGDSFTTVGGTGCPTPFI